MPYILKYNYGSFSFEKFSNYLLSLMITILDSDSDSPRLNLHAIADGNKKISLPAMSPLYGHIIYNKSASIPEFVGPSVEYSAQDLKLFEERHLDDTLVRFSHNYVDLIEEIKQRRIVKKYLRLNYDKDIISYITLAINNFKNTDIFPPEPCDFTELLRLIVDLSRGNQDSLKHTSPKLDEQRKELEKTWILQANPPKILETPTCRQLKESEDSAYKTRWPLALFTVTTIAASGLYYTLQPTTVPRPSLTLR